MLKRSLRLLREPGRLAVRLGSRVAPGDHEAIFSRLHRRRGWGDGESVSGPGSAVERYVGADVVRALVEQNAARHAAPGREFLFPRPLLAIDEHCTHTGGIYRDKILAVWPMSTVPAPREEAP